MAKTMKRQTVIAKAIQFDPDGRATGVKFGFPDKSVRLVELDNLHSLTQWHAMAHGIAQKVGDAAAMSRNEAGQSASVADKVAAAIEVIERISDPSEYRWNAEKTGGGAESYLFKALCRLYDGEHGKPARTPERLREWLDGLDDKAKKALAVKNSIIAGLIADIRAESVEDTDEPDLSELDEDDDTEE